MQNDKQQEQQRKTLFPIPINGCLSVIILGALACMSVKGCKMVNMKYEETKAQHEIYMDSINKIKAIQYNTKADKNGNIKKPTKTNGKQTNRIR